MKTIYASSLITKAISMHQHTTHTITVHTDDQRALRAFADNNIPDHLRGPLSTHMHQHPYLRVLLEWIPGHQSIDGNKRAHALARDTQPLSNPLIWPRIYDPKKEHAHHRKMRRAGQPHGPLSAFLTILHSRTTGRHLHSISSNALINICDMFPHTFTNV
ncbi:hypothetical protein ISCGN_027328 [Ixodes scapularis]